MRRRRNQADARFGTAQLGNQRADLVARQLTAFARLGPLGHLDLQHFGVDQVMRGHAKAARRHLLDLGHLDRAVAGRIFAALTRVGAPAQAVHRLGQRFVGFWRQRAQRHARRVKALENGFHRLDFVQRDGLVGLELEQVAEHRHRTGVHQVGVGLIGVVIAVLHRLLQHHHHVRVIGVVFLAVDVLEQAALGNRAHRVERQTGQFFLVGFKVGEVRAGHTRHGAAQAQVHHLVVHADNFKQLGTAIAGDGGNPHLRQHLEQALVDALAVVAQSIHRVGLDAAGGDHVQNGLISQVRIHRRSTVAHQTGNLVRVACRAGFNHQVSLAAQTGVDQRVMHRARGKQRMNRQTVGGNGAVGQHHNHRAFAHGGNHFAGQLAQRGFQAQAGRVVVQVKAGGLELRFGLRHHKGEFFVGQQRRTHFQALGVFSRLLEHAAFRAKAGVQRHHHRFADRVDRRVGHLGKLLAQVVKRRTHLLRQHRHRRVVTHRTHGFLGIFGQHAQNLVALFKAQAKQLLLAGKLVLGHAGHGGIFFQRDFQMAGVMANPLAIRLCGLEDFVNGLWQQQFAIVQVNRDNLARLDPALFHHVFRLVVPHAHF